MYSVYLYVSVRAKANVKISEGRCGRSIFCNIYLSFHSVFSLYLYLCKSISRPVPTGNLQQGESKSQNSN